MASGASDRGPEAGMGCWMSTNEHEGEQAADQAVEDDGLGECEAEPHDPLQLAAQLGWRATDWIFIEPKIVPMPMPAPTEPSPMPRASAISLPWSTTSPVVSKRTSSARTSYARLDRPSRCRWRTAAAKMNAWIETTIGLEEVERRAEDDRDREDPDRRQEDQPDEGQDQHVTCEHVREESD